MQLCAFPILPALRSKILPQNKNKDLLPGNLIGFHGAEFGT